MFRKLIYLILFIFLISSISCKRVSNSVLDEGSPYNGKTIELNYQIYNESCSKLPSPLSIFKTNNNFFIGTLSEYDSLTKNNSSACITNILDFSKYMLVPLYGVLQGTDHPQFIPRIYLDHIKKTMKVELQGKVTDIGQIRLQYYFYDNWLIVPKLPQNYKFIVSKVSPVH